MHTDTWDSEITSHTVPEDETVAHMAEVTHSKLRDRRCPAVGPELQPYAGWCVQVEPGGAIGDAGACARELRRAITNLAVV